MIKVSILIPTYNQPELFRTCLVSISKQSFLDFEIIITDDSDSSAIELVTADFPQLPITYHRNSMRRGSPGNWNEALCLASGEYIKILHHDDCFASSDALGHFVSALDGVENASIAFCNSINRDSMNNIININRPADKIDLLRLERTYLFPNNIIGAPSATIFRKIPDCWFDENLKWVVDIEYYLRLLAGGRDFVYIDKPLVNILIGMEGRVTADCENNPDLLLYEWLYLYNKVGGSNLGRQQRAFLKGLVDRYPSYNYRELLSRPGINRIPKFLTFWMLGFPFRRVFSMVNRLMRKVIRRVLKVLNK